jgi:hypothetical protein
LNWAPGTAQFLILYHFPEPPFHAGHNPVEYVIITDSKLFRIPVFGTVNDKTNTGGVHGIVDHINQAADPTRFAQPGGKIENRFGHLSNTFQQR